MSHARCLAEGHSHPFIVAPPIGNFGLRPNSFSVIEFLGRHCAYPVVYTQTQVSLEGWHNLSRCREAPDTNTKIASKAWRADTKQWRPMCWPSEPKNELASTCVINNRRLL